MRPTTLAFSPALLAVALAALALSGCPETASCPADRPIREGGMCRASVTDAGMDAGPIEDAGSDAGPPCGVECVAPTPYCDISAPPTCRACLSAEHCSAATPRCAGGICARCESSADCAEHPASPNCHMPSGECRACVEASEAEICGSNWCNPVTRECSMVARGSAEACEPCARDADCNLGSYCIATAYRPATGTPVTDAGRFCFPRSTGTCALNPYIVATGRMTVSGNTVDVCIVNEAVTSCTALNAWNAPTPCTTDTPCGIGGVCRPAPGTRTCTYACTSNSNCGTVCDVGTGLCRPPA